MRKFLRAQFVNLLGWEASLFRSRYHGPLIAITGSSGKTSTKEAIGVLVRKAYGVQNCLVTAKNLNSEIGVPLTLFGYKDTPESWVAWALVPFRGLLAALLNPLPKCIVLELAADHKGDIAYLGRLVCPTHVIITNISEAHSQFLGLLEEIQKEKTSLVRFLSTDGTAIFNGDNRFLAEFPVSPKQQKLLVRLHSRADYFASGVRVGLHGTEAVLHHGNRTQRVMIERWGEHHIYSALYVVAVGDSLSIDSTIQRQALKEIKALPGRGMLIEGKKKSYLLDDTYNAASPDAVRFSLETLAKLPARRRVAILGDMRELGSPEEVHKEIGRFARQHVDYVIGVGPMSQGFKPDEWFKTAEEALPAALRQLNPGVIMLLKGSQNTIRLEKIVKALMLHPSQATKLLVRQEAYWANKP